MDIVPPSTLADPFEQERLKRSQIRTRHEQWKLRRSQILTVIGALSALAAIAAKLLA